LLYFQPDASFGPLKQTPREPDQFFIRLDPGKLETFPGDPAKLAGLFSRPGAVKASIRRSRAWAGWLTVNSIALVFEDLTLGTDVKFVSGLAVLNFDFVIPFGVPFRFQNVTRRVTGFDCFQYTPGQLANRNVLVRP
jgi:hypothetical protein